MLALVQMHVSMHLSLSLCLSCSYTRPCVGDQRRLGYSYSDKTEEGTDVFDGIGDIVTSGPPWTGGVSKRHRGAPVSGRTMERPALLFWKVWPGTAL